jgi:N5-(cytidine 5'-diphosphoramidyl)-L-glutamine hydrolase
MKTIWVTQRLVRDPATGEVRDALDVRWASFLLAAGALPLPVPSGAPLPELFRKTRPGGLLLTGGNDLYSLSRNPLSKARDQFEKGAVKLFSRERLPILGVCRGMQLLARSSGGVVCPVKAKTHAGTWHMIEVRGSRLLPAQSLRVSSFHRFGVVAMGRGFCATSFAEDDTIESMEHEKLPIVGIMWHPERRKTPDLKDLAIFRRLFRL